MFRERNVAPYSIDQTASFHCRNYEIATKRRLKDKVSPKQSFEIYASINPYFSRNRLFTRHVVSLQVLRLRGYQTRSTWQVKHRNFIAIMEQLARSWTDRESKTDGERQVGGKMWSIRSGSLPEQAARHPFKRTLGRFNTLIS